MRKIMAFSQSNNYLKSLCVVGCSRLSCTFFDINSTGRVLPCVACDFSRRAQRLSNVSRYDRPCLYFLSPSPLEITKVPFTSLQTETRDLLGNKDTANGEVRRLERGYSVDFLPLRSFLRFADSKLTALYRTQLPFKSQLRLMIL